MIGLDFRWRSRFTPDQQKKSAATELMSVERKTVCQSCVGERDINRGIDDMNGNEHNNKAITDSCLACLYLSIKSAIVRNRTRAHI